MNEIVPNGQATGKSRLLAGSLAFLLFVLGFTFLFYAVTRRNIPVGLIGSFGVYWGYRFMRLWKTGRR